MPAPVAHITNMFRSWFKLPTQYATLHPDALADLQAGNFWAACGHVKLSDRAFSHSLQTNDQQLAIRVEYADALRMWGDRHGQLRVLNDSHNQHGSPSANGALALLLQLYQSDAIIRTAVQVKQAYECAAQVKSYFQDPERVQAPQDVEVCLPLYRRVVLLIFIGPMHRPILQRYRYLSEPL